MLEKDIVKLGLSEKEAQVYLASLELGPSTVQAISQKAKVNRATTYVIIDSLTDMGLMSTYDEGKKTLFSAESPHRLLEYLQNQKDSVQKKIGFLKDKMPELQSLVNTIADKPKVKYYEGIEGLRVIQSEFINNLNPGDVVYVFLPLDDYVETGLKDKVSDLVEKRSKKKILTKVIYTSKKGRQLAYEEIERASYKDYHYVDYEKYSFNGGINIWSNKISMIDYKGRMGGVVIENKVLAETLKSIFNLIWDSK